jgi:hypothetical protein
MTHVRLVVGVYNPTVRRRQSLPASSWPTTVTWTFTRSSWSAGLCRHASRRVEHHLAALRDVFDASKVVIKGDQWVDFRQLGGGGCSRSAAACHTRAAIPMSTKSVESPTWRSRAHKCRCTSRGADPDLATAKDQSSGSRRATCVHALLSTSEQVRIAVARAQL